MRHRPKLCAVDPNTAGRSAVGPNTAGQIAVGRSVVVAVAFVLGLAACDTGDGKTLRPVDPNATTTSTAVPTIGTGVVSSIELDGTGGGATDIGLGGGVFLPGGSIPTNDLSDDGLSSEDSFSDDGFALFAPWTDGATIDARHTCDGDDVQPSISWASPPSGALQLAFVMIDESSIIEGAPFVHWVIGGVEPGDGSITEGQAPLGAVVGSNSFGSVGWRGPCPPVGDGPHTYKMTMYALNQQVELADGIRAAEFIDYIEALSIGSTDLSFVYER